jgi:CheY-like chemotaxis protein
MALVLLVEPDADARALYGEFLRHAPCEIEEAEDGREALAKAITRHPHIIVTETRLPGISGYDLCRLLREDVLTRDIPIVVLTGDALAANARMTAAAADVVLLKPCLPEQLATTIKQLMGQSRDLRARSAAARATAGSPRQPANAVLERAQTVMNRRVTLSRAYNRYDTTQPPLAPPPLVCPSCDLPLRYVKSHIGGVSERCREQWDYFECGEGCGTFEYRQRTRRLRRAA